MLLCFVCHARAAAFLPWSLPRPRVGSKFSQMGGASKVDRGLPSGFWFRDVLQIPSAELSALAWVARWLKQSPLLKADVFTDSSYVVSTWNKVK